MENLPNDITTRSEEVVTSTDEPGDVNTTKVEDKAKPSHNLQESDINVYSDGTVSRSDEIITSSSISLVHSEEKKVEDITTDSNSNSTVPDSPTELRRDQEFIFEHFLVLGVSPNNAKIKQVARNIASSTTSVPSQVTVADAEILYQYPPNKPYPLKE